MACGTPGLGRTSHARIARSASNCPISGIRSRIRPTPSAFAPSAYGEDAGDTCNSCGAKSSGIEMRYNAFRGSIRCGVSFHNSTPGFSDRVAWASTVAKGDETACVMNDQPRPRSLPERWESMMMDWSPRSRISNPNSIAHCPEHDLKGALIMSNA